jgi:hypothetical protein
LRIWKKSALLAGGNSKSYGNLVSDLAEFGESWGGKSNFSFSYSCLISIFCLIWSIKKIRIIFPLMQRVRMLVFTAVLMYNPLW